MFVMVVDYIVRLTVTEPSMGFGWKRLEGSPAPHIADLNYANNTALLANTVGNAQHLLTALETHGKLWASRLMLSKQSLDMQVISLASQCSQHPVAPSNRWMTSNAWNVE